jgi:hypothetical protein
VKKYDGRLVSVPGEVVDHIERKHPEMLSVMGLAKHQLISFIVEALEALRQVYVDTDGSRYFLKNLNDLYLNVVVARGTAKTAYLMSQRTCRRMGKTRWLRRLY